VFGSVGVKQFTAECRQDPEVVSLRDRIEGVVDERVATDEAHATVRLHDGRVFEQHVAHAVGSIERPLSDRDLEAKLRSLAEPVLTATAIDELTAMLWSLETLRDAGAVARAAAPAAADAARNSRREKAMLTCLR
jgi:2-methylcitrate dehydratase PrpD